MCKAMWRMHIHEKALSIISLHKRMSTVVSLAKQLPTARNNSAPHDANIDSTLSRSQPTSSHRKSHERHRYQQFRTQQTGKHNASIQSKN